MQHIPAPTLERLSQYLRIVEDLNQQGALAVGSQALAEMAQVPSFQVRKDLAYCGRLGRRGQGYAVRLLLRSLREVLGQNRRWNYVIVGMSELGVALTQYPWPAQYVCVGLFDGPESPNLSTEHLYMQQSTRWLAAQRHFALPPEPDVYTQPDTATSGYLPPVPRELKVRPLAELAGFVREQAVDLAMLCVSAQQAQASAEVVADTGIEAILNFTGKPLLLGSPHLQEGSNEKRDIVIENVDFVKGLHQLSVQTLAAQALHAQDDLTNPTEEKI